MAAAFLRARWSDEALCDEPFAHILQHSQCVYETLHRQCDNEFGNRAKLAVAAALDDFETMKFEPCHAVDDGHILESVAKMSGHVGIPSSDLCVLRFRGSGQARPSPIVL